MTWTQSLKEACRHLRPVDRSFNIGGVTRKDRTHLSKMGSAVTLSIVLALTAADLCEAGGTLGIGGVVQTMNPHLIPPAARFPEHATDQGRNSIDSLRVLGHFSSRFALLNRKHTSPPWCRFQVFLPKVPVVKVMQTIGVTQHVCLHCLECRNLQHKPQKPSPRCHRIYRNRPAVLKLIPMGYRPNWYSEFMLSLVAQKTFGPFVWAVFGVK